MLRRSRSDRGGAAAGLPRAQKVAGGPANAIARRRRKQNDIVYSSQAVRCSSNPSAADICWRITNF
jgi:hypothetical protein